MPRPWRPEDTRTEGQVDYARVIHSASFRRLQGKTQILNLGDSDFYRTRLTHSLEVAQIARGIGQQFGVALADHPAVALLPDIDLLQAIGLSHDLGHPPFGHGGEVALNYCMRDAGGFEGNGQTLRILAHLEKFQAGHGANLMRRSLLGVLKYPASFTQVRNADIVPRLTGGTSVLSLLDRDACKPPKCYLDCDGDLVDWILDPLSSRDRDIFCSVEAKPGKHGKPKHKAFDCSIMDLADDIAFGVHDLEDAIALGLMSREVFAEHVPVARCTSLLIRLGGATTAAAGDRYTTLLDQLFGNEQERKQAIGLLVNHFITEARIETCEALDAPLLRYRAKLTPDARVFLDALIATVRAEVIYSAAVQQLEFKGQMMVVQVFEAMASDPSKLLPQATRERYAAAASENEQNRVLCDHIAGMTDAFLLKCYERLFSPRIGSIFDRL